MGSHLSDYLINEMGFQVVILDDLSGGFRANVSQHAEFVEGSIVDAKCVNFLFDKYSFDYIYHLAAYAAEGLSHFIKRFNYTNNLIGSVNLINACVNTGVKCIVFTSSIAVYGQNQLPMTEGLTPNPEDSYGIAKLAVEMELKATHDLFGLDYVIFRPHNVYGERQNLGDKYRNVIGIFMNRIMQGQDLIVFGDGEQRRAFTYVKDVIPRVAEAARTPAALNQVFNIGADQHYSVNELAETVSKAMRVPVRIRHVEARKEVKLAFSDHSKLDQVLPRQTTTLLSDGVERMAEWARSVGVRASQDFQEIEIRDRMPSVWR